VLLGCHADEKDVKAAMKQQPNKGGIYFPIAAVQVRNRCSAGMATTQHQHDLSAAHYQTACRRSASSQHHPHGRLVNQARDLPYPAVMQKFDATKMDFENGVFLGPIAYLTFNGPYAMSGRQLTFDVSTMNIGLGPLKFSIPLKKDAKSIADMDPA
jgi:hypothetical protein